MLNQLRDWIHDEFEAGNRTKASLLYKIFCKYARIQYPNVTLHELRYYYAQDW